MACLPHPAVEMKIPLVLNSVLQFKDSTCFNLHRTRQEYKTSSLETLGRWLHRLLQTCACGETEAWADFIFLEVGSALLGLCYVLVQSVLSPRLVGGWGVVHVASGDRAVPGLLQLPYTRHCNSRASWGDCADSVRWLLAYTNLTRTLPAVPSTCVTTPSRDVSKMIKSAVRCYLVITCGPAPASRSTCRRGAEEEHGVASSIHP